MPATTVDPFGSAISMLEMLREHQISAVELLELHIDRIEKYNPALNAVVITNFDEARETARRADERLAAGEEGALLGLPLTIKDCIYVRGMPNTGGVPERADEICDEDAPVAASVRAAGAVIMGKTNVPPYAADNQSFNPIFGRTNNPWNLDRTPGGSSGGAAAAVAAGLTPLEYGGDLGGSIRDPAAFCGIYGHKSSQTAAPQYGHFPGGLLPNAAVTMAVQGPLARTVADLTLGLEVILGPGIGEDVAWRLELPPARHDRLSEFRVVAMPEVDWLPVDDEILAAKAELANRLRAIGASVSEAHADEIAFFRDYFKTYLRILMAMSAPQSPEERQAEADQGWSSSNEFLSAMADGMVASAHDYIGWFTERERYRQMYREFFENHDILLAPCNIVNAFPHDERPSDSRTLDVNGEQVDYLLQLAYPSLCNLSGQPGTAFPVGFASDGLPIGLQAIGPYLEDRTTLKFAELIEREFGGFVAPVGREEG